MEIIEFRKHRKVNIPKCEYFTSSLDELTPMFYMCHVPNGVNIKPPPTFFSTKKWISFLCQKLESFNMD
jgi:hypothetical protein